MGKDGSQWSIQLLSSFILYSAGKKGEHRAVLYVPAKNVLSYQHKLEEKHSRCFKTNVRAAITTLLVRRRTLKHTHTHARPRLFIDHITA